MPSSLVVPRVASILSRMSPPRLSRAASVFAGGTAYLTSRPGARPLTTSASSSTAPANVHNCNASRSLDRKVGNPLNLGNLAEPYGNRDDEPMGSKVSSHRARESAGPPPLMSQGVTAPASTKHQERCVLVVNVPWSILPQDIQAAAGPGLATAVQSVEMLYNASGNFGGKAMVTLDSPQSSAAYAKQANRFVAGRHLSTQIMTLEEGKEIVIPSDPTSPSVRKNNSLATTSLFAAFLVSRFGGRIVCLAGVPQDFTVKRLSNLLWHGDWQLEPSARNPEWNVCLTRLFHRMRRTGSTVSRERKGPITDAMVRISRDSGSRSRGIKLDATPTADGLIDAGRLDPIFSFIPPGPRQSSRMHMIVFATESEAHRFVRRWHRQPFNPQGLGWKYILSARILH